MRSCVSCHKYIQVYDAKHLPSDATSHWENDTDPKKSGMTQSTLLEDMFPTSKLNDVLFSLHCMKLVMLQYGLQRAKHDTATIAFGND